MPVTSSVKLDSEILVQCPRPLKEAIRARAESKQRAMQAHIRELMLQDLEAARAEGSSVWDEILERATPQ